MKAIILCSWGATSASLAQNVQKAADKEGLDLEIDAGSTIDFKKNASEYDVALLEPQVRHMMKEVTEIGDKNNVKVELVDMQAFATFDGETVLKQIIDLYEEKN